MGILSWTQRPFYPDTDFSLRPILQPSATGQCPTVSCGLPTWTLPLQQPCFEEICPSLLTLPTYVLHFGLKSGVYGRYFCKHVIGNLRAGWVVFWVLRVPWCHAREFDALTRITFPDLQQLLLALVL
jgi:hypothetical protein